MNAGTLILGAVIGIMLFAGALLLTGEDVNADSVCNDRLEGNWSGEKVNTDFGNQSMKIECTQGERVENLTVGISVEVDE